MKRKHIQEPHIISLTKSNKDTSPSKMRRSSRRRITIKFMILFVTLLLSLIIAIHKRYKRSLISFTDQLLLKKKKESNRAMIIGPNKKQHFVLVYGTNSSGYAKVQSDLSTWTRQFKLHPWVWALPEITPEKYRKEQNFEPLMDSLTHLSTTVPAAEYIFDRKKHAESKFFLSKFQDGFIEQWVQNRNLLIGSDAFCTFLDEKHGDDLFRAFAKTLPWNHSRFSLLSEGALSVIILHRSAHKKHIKDLWTSSMMKNHGIDNGETFSSWLLNDFNFDVLDSYGFANKMRKKGIAVSFVSVDEVKDDLSQYISCNLLEFPCENDKVPDLISNFTESKLRNNNRRSNDISESLLDEIERAIKQHETQYERCLGYGDSLIEFYPRRPEKQQAVSTDNGISCPDSNGEIKHEIRNILASRKK